MEFRLVKPYLGLEKEYIEYITEWENAGEKIVPYSSRREKLSYSELLKRWENDANEEVYQKGFVPATLYFLTDEKERIYGALHIRHELNEQLRKFGGHIGYGIRPSERKQGLAAKMLQMALPIAKELGIENALVVCDRSNKASAKTIIKNGGILENEVIDGDTIVQRYWIQL